MQILPHPRIRFHFFFTVDHHNPAVQRKKYRSKYVLVNGFLSFVAVRFRFCIKKSAAEAENGENVSEREIKPFEPERFEGRLDLEERMQNAVRMSDLVFDPTLACCKMCRSLYDTINRKEKIEFERFCAASCAARKGKNQTSQEATQNEF